MKNNMFGKIILIGMVFAVLTCLPVSAGELIVEDDTGDLLSHDTERINTYESSFVYDIDAAVEYAYANKGAKANDNNPMQCAEFVGRCLVAGGFDIDPTGRVLDVRKRIRNTGMFKEVAITDYEYPNILSNGRISRGDVIVYMEDMNEYDDTDDDTRPPHMVFVTKVENNIVKITDRNLVNYDKNGNIVSIPSKDADRQAADYKHGSKSCKDGTMLIYAYHYIGSSGDEIASGTIDGIRWKIDKNGKLTVNGAGSVSFDDGTTFGNKSAWLAYRDDIVEAEVDISGATDLSGLFLYCESLKKVDLSKLDTSNVTNMARMFEGCCSLENIDVSNFNTSNVTNMSKMFATSSLFMSSKLKSLDLSNFDTSNVTNMSGMFYNCGLRSLDLRSFNTSNVINMSSMFSNCLSLTNLNLSSFNTANVVDMGSMFYNCNLSGVDVSNFNTSNVTDMSRMFMRCAHYYDGSPSMSFDVSGFNTSKVEDMSEMFSGFYYCSSINVSGFDTSNVTNMSDMFAYCDNLTSVDLSSFDVSRIVNRINYVGLYGVLRGCNNLSSVKAPKNTGFYSIDLPGEGWVDFTTGEAVSQIMPSAASGRLFIRKDVIKYKKGDATGDGVVAMGDVIKTARAVAGGINLSDKEKIAADVTGDGDIGMGDVVKLARFVAGSLSEL